MAFSCFQWREGGDIIGRLPIQGEVEEEEIEIGRLKGLGAASSYSAITLDLSKIIARDWN